ncbi:MAG: metal-dependent hydrolase [Saprospiraceae bacterium]|nr:metal-dependent hydrolase [Saprospiraceae bacterium]
MDSLTQVVLGAAVGEAVLGKKIGNRAILWGAVAGTIPDLDVVANAFLSPIDALAFHRGITHSFVFSILAALAFGWLLHKMYQYKHHKYIAIVCWAFIVLSIAGSVIMVDTISIIKTVAGLVLLGTGVYFIYYKYQKDSYGKPLNVSVGDWQRLFFFSLVTHPILDCFTTYGTQMLLPFSDYRIGFNNISVADPAYTVPFLIFVIIAMFYPKENRKRAIFNWLGIGISSAYMLMTFYNKDRVNHIFEASLQSEKIEYSRYMTTPTILNNILWYGVAESDSAYYFGQYSFFDKEKIFKIQRLDKNSEMTKTYLNDPTFKTLRWFSNDFYYTELLDNGNITFKDLRFGTFRTSADTSEDFVFRFNLIKNDDGSLRLINRGDGPRDGNFKEMFGLLWNRILGQR